MGILPHVTDVTKTGASHRRPHAAHHPATPTPAAPTLAELSYEARPERPNLLRQTPLLRWTTR